MIDAHLPLPVARQTKELKRQYQLAYAYRMVNTSQVDEYVERALVMVSINSTLLPVMRWTIQYELTQIDYVGSTEATEFFRQHEQQSRSQPPIVVLTNTDGVIDSSADVSVQTAATSSILSGHVAFIVAGIWGIYPNGERLRGRSLPHHFGDIDLPLVETLSLSKTNQEYQVQISGQVDSSRFDQSHFNRFVKDMTDIYDLRTRVELTHEVIYWLSEDGLVERAEEYTETEVGGAYNVTFARTLKQLA